MADSLALELLAPAGGPEALSAALAAGADAVYFGLKTLNARRGATNFHFTALDEVVREVHGAGARAHLALNTLLHKRELGQAARALALAAEHGVDAVLICDPALLLLRPVFSGLALHASTQTALTNSAAVEAARQFGLARAVLARELSLEEIRACAAVPGIETEVFCQGALCFSVSGRCLLSSWVGGRSGNRGSCAAPCRVPWHDGAGRAARALAMHDLSLLDDLAELAAAGVASLKIEGRLKTADWVRASVGLYRAVLDGASPGAARDGCEDLGGYAGRQQTDAYLKGRREGLTGAAGRPAGAPAAGAADSPPAPGEAGEGYALALQTVSGRLVCTLTRGAFHTTWELPLSRVRKPARAVSLEALGSWLAEVEIQGQQAAAVTTDDPARLVPRKTTKALADRISAALHRARKGVSNTIRLDLAPDVRRALELPATASENRCRLGEGANAVRLSRVAVDAFCSQVSVEQVVVVGMAPRGVKSLAKRLGARLVVALPSVFFEDEIPTVRATCEACAAAAVAVEVNDWGGWQLARAAGARALGGPGLAVLNPWAARFWQEQGLGGVTASVEADRQQLEDLAEGCPLPLRLCVFGRPALLTTRAVLPQAGPGMEIEDGRRCRLRARAAGSVTTWHPTEPFDLSDLRNKRICACWLEADLMASPEPLLDWYNLGERRRRKRRFNYDRSLY